MHVVATAGHVDHGKSTLVRALTGMEPDRWAEERRRGMTIDLGYAWTSLPDGSTIAFVDVPGHERFITNMLAGVGPVPAVLLVVAADEGWSRQTGEHLAALEALGVRHGVLAITRADLGDAELAEDEARDYLAGSGLAGIEAVAVSAVTGDGLADLRNALVRMTTSLPHSDLPTRLWVDRVFTVRGSGTIVTGTLSSGSLELSDALVIASTGEEVRLRSIECLKEPVTSVGSVARVALNLRGMKRTEISRGDALVAPHRWPEVSVVDVRLVNVTSTPPIQPTLHIGSSAMAVRLRPLGEDTARLTFPTPLPLRTGERAILRDSGRQEVLAGVIILDVDPPPLRRRGAAAARAAALDTIGVEFDAGAEVRRRGFVTRGQLKLAGILPEDAPSPEGAMALGDWLVDEELWRGWNERFVAAVDDWARTRPLAPGMPRAAVVAALDLPDRGLLDHLVAQSPDFTADDSGIHRRDVASVLPDDVETALDTLVSRLGEDPFNAAGRPELDAAGLDEQYLATAARQGRLVRLAAGVYLGSDSIEEALLRLSALPQPFSLAEAREVLRSSRRVVLPLLELLDKRGYTRLDKTERRTILDRRAT